jgi:hypothetical protein
MKRNRWLRWFWLFLAVEGCLWLAGACRPYFDYSGSVDRSKPLLIHTRNSLLVSVDGGQYRVFEINDEITKKLTVFITMKNRPQASRTRSGQLLDDHGRVLLGEIDEGQLFSYSSARDILVWGAVPGKTAGLNIRQGGKKRFVSSWSIQRIEVQPDGKIWVLEEDIWHRMGVAIIDTDGKFLGWRVFPVPLGEFVTVVGMAEADETVQPLVNRLLTRPEKIPE